MIWGDCDGFEEAPFGILLVREPSMVWWLLSIDETVWVEQGAY
jgi:hypothetical protein